MILLFEKIKEKLKEDLHGMTPEGSQSLVSYYQGYLDALSEDEHWQMDALMEIRHWLLYTFENYRASQQQIIFKDKKENQHGYCPLHLAVLMHSDRMINALLAEERSVDPLDNEGNTPLHLAVLANDLRTVHKLLKAGANPIHTNNEGRRPDQRTLDQLMLRVLAAAREQQVLASVATPKLKRFSSRRF